MRINKYQIVPKVPFILQGNNRCTTFFVLYYFIELRVLYYYYKMDHTLTYDKLHWIILNYVFSFLLLQNGSYIIQQNNIKRKRMLRIYYFLVKRKKNFHGQPNTIITDAVNYYYCILHMYSDGQKKVYKIRSVRVSQHNFLPKKFLFFFFFKYILKNINLHKNSQSNNICMYTLWNRRLLAIL